MAEVVANWEANDPPNGYAYDGSTLEFDPIRIQQETGAYFETLLRNRVNQAARAVTLAFAVGGSLDAVGSRYPGGMPRLAGEGDDAYRTRVWLSPNTFTQNGVYENYVFFSLTAAQAAGTPLQDCQVQSTPGSPQVYITIMANGAPVTALKDANGDYTGTFSAYPSPIPTDAQIASVATYIAEPGQGRKGQTDVVNVNGPNIVNATLSVQFFMFPGWDQGAMMNVLCPALAAMIEGQRYLGYSLTRSAIDAALKVSGVSSVLVSSPPVVSGASDPDVLVPLAANQAINLTSISLIFAGYAGIGPLSPAS
jgi:phage-related baseplate assembly protein